MFGTYLFIGMVIFAIIYAMGGFRDKHGNGGHNRAFERDDVAHNGMDEPTARPNHFVEDWKETCRQSQALMEEFDRCQRESAMDENTGGPS